MGKQKASVPRRVETTGRLQSCLWRDSHPNWHARKIHKQTFKVIDALECCSKRCQEWVLRTVWLGRKRGKATRRRLLTRRLRVGKTLSNARMSCVARVEDSLCT